MRLLLVWSMVVVALLAACGSSDKEVATLSDCSPKEARLAVDGLQPLMDEFSDHFDRAGSTSRIALSPVIADMQKTVRDLRRLDIPACALSAQTSLVTACDRAIDGFLAFMSDEPDSTVQRLFEEASDLMDTAGQELRKLQSDALQGD